MTQADRAARLAAEIGAPDVDALVDAPVLTNWHLVTWPGETAPRLTGSVTGHPTITDVTMTTSPVFHVDLRQGLARTVNRWYRLAAATYRPVDPARREAELDAVCTEVEAFRARIAATIADG